MGRQTYVALLRGINVGGHHKVPMAELRGELKEMSFRNVETLLNSGNAIFDAEASATADLEERLARRLEDRFGFEIPVMVRTGEEILALAGDSPFGAVEVTDDIRLYITFLKELPEQSPELPWVSEDGSYRIIELRDRMVCSVLDLSVTSTPKGMDNLEKLFGSDLTTRNWNTVNRITGKLQ